MATTGIRSRERELTIDSAGQAIRSLREQAGLSLQDLAERLDWDKGRLSKYENNHLALSLPVIEEIASAFDKPPPSLVFACLQHRYPALSNSQSKVGRLVKRLTDELAKL